MLWYCIRFEDAAGLVKLHLICYPESNLARSLQGQPQAADEATDNDLLQVFSYNNYCYAKFCPDLSLGVCMYVCRHSVSATV